MAVVFALVFAQFEPAAYFWVQDQQIRELALLHLYELFLAHLSEDL
jgi:hypothetical protein